MTNQSTPEGAILDPLPTRREVLRLGFTGLVTLVGLGSGLSGKVFGSIAATGHSTPALEEGPYWINETTSRFHRADLRANLDGRNLQPGLPLHLGLTVSYLHKGKVVPLPHGFVYLWSTNALGVYSGEEQENTLSDTYMRGYQITNAQGYVQYTTLYPGWYGGRTIHIHARIRTYPKNDPTQKPIHDFETQLFFDDAVSNHVLTTISPYNTRPGRDTTNTIDHVYTGPSLDGTLAKNAGRLMEMKVRTKSLYAVAQMPLILDLSKHARAGFPPPGGPGGPGGPGSPGGPPPGDWGDGPPPPPPGGFGDGPPPPPPPGGFGNPPGD